MHKASLCNLDDNGLNNYDLFVCRECNNYVTSSRNLLNSHQLNHVQCRCTSQFQIVTNKLYDKVKHVLKNHWRDRLAYLTRHIIPQVDFRSTLMTQISFCLEADFFLHIPRRP